MAEPNGVWLRLKHRNARVKILRLDKSVLSFLYESKRVATRVDRWKNGLRILKNGYLVHVGGPLLFFFLLTPLIACWHTERGAPSQRNAKNLSTSFPEETHVVKKRTKEVENNNLIIILDNFLTSNSSKIIFQNQNLFIFVNKISNGEATATNTMKIICI